MLRTIIVTMLLLAGVLLLSAPPAVTAAPQPQQGPGEETLMDGDAMIAEIAAELADDDNGESAASVEGPPPLFAGIPPRPGPARSVAWVEGQRRLHSHDLRPLLPPPRTTA